jgi:hypothetical protein
MFSHPDSALLMLIQPEFTKTIQDWSPETACAAVSGLSLQQLVYR